MAKEPTKKALAMAFDAGQAAQRFGLPEGFTAEEACPFKDDRPEERDAYLDGYGAELAEKWQRSPVPGLQLNLGEG